MSKNFTAAFTGFQTLAQAQAFIDWYSGSGEQHSGEWLAEAGCGLSGAYVDYSYGTVVDNNTLTIKLRLSPEEEEYE